uniref:Bucky ball n=1 Tax=Mola mola TaxID=94237 RepID=A0A3Q3VU82_MOLML
MKGLFSLTRGQQRAQHPRPFFYVQPPSQPYFLYQHWQLNNPYGHYGLPAGFGFGRPYMHPYQYMQYPGFVYPHAPIYPVDHRRVFEPRFHASAWSDVPRQQYYPQPHGRRETACSEAQTDPSDAITKLIECLDKIRGGERELDSGVASQSSRIFSPGEEKKSEEQGDALSSALDGSRLESSAVTCSDSMTAVYDAESSHRSLDALSPQGCWLGGLEEEWPLDSSSVHEECSTVDRPAAEIHFHSLEKAEVTDILSDTSVTDPSFPKCDVEELLSLDPADKAFKAEHRKADQDYQILKLPFESILAPVDAGANRISSPAAPYYYNYLSMHTTQERMSVLSPSLDELSSRDEMFSTDLEDADLFPKHVYAGKRIAEVVSVSPRAAEEAEEVWLQGSQRFVCACCGKSLAKGAGRSKGHKMYRNEGGDSEDSRYGRGCEQPVRVVVRKHSLPRKPHTVPLRHVAKPWYKRGQYKDPTDPVNQEEGHDLKQEAVEGETAEASSDSQRKVMHHRPRDEDDDEETPPLHWERG